MKITNEIEYKKAFEVIDGFVAEGFEGNTEKEKQFLEVALAIEAYEDAIPIMPLQVPKPQTLSEMLSLKMFQLKLKQKDLAAMLDITPTRLSEVMTGKRKVNMDLAKRLYQKLSIDPAFILEHA
jgi:HTH-type transcriptional regulator/antitoxin HigA